MGLTAGQSILLAFGGILAAAAVIGAYALLGGVGVTLFGLGALFIAIRLDLERDGPVGGARNEGMFAATLSAPQHRTADSKPLEATEGTAFTRLNTWVQIGAAIILLAGVALWRWEL